MRPLSITIISWFFIVGGVVVWLTLLFTFDDPLVREAMSVSALPPAAQFGLLIGDVIVRISSGIGMLNGMNWARLLYLVWGTIALIITLITTPSFLMMIPGAIVFAVVIFFLFRPAASDYFAMM